MACHQKSAIIAYIHVQAEMWRYELIPNCFLYVSQSNLMYFRTKEYIRNKTIDIIRNKKQ